MKIVNLQTLRSFPDMYFIWLNNLKLVEGKKLGFSLKIFVLLPLELCCKGCYTIGPPSYATGRKCKQYQSGFT